MRRKVKMLAAVPAAALLMMGMATMSFAAPTNAPNSTSPGTTNTNTTISTSTTKNGWVSEVSGRETVWYYYANGVRYRNQWVKSNNLWYYMDSDGVMLKGWQTLNGVDYYFDSNGAMATGWRKVEANDDRDSYSSGPMAGSSSSGSNWYYFAPAGTKGYAEGEMVQGWLQLGDKWYYLADDNVESENVVFEYGQMVYGEVEIDGNEYFFGKENEGVMRTGFIKDSEINNSNSSSIRPGGSYSDREGTYYYGTSGSRIGMKWADSWLNLNNEWYYFDEEGKMVGGQMATDSRGRWCDYDSADATYYYYLDPSSGKMQTGWINVKESSNSTSNSPVGSGSSSGKYYQYYDASGAMHFGWLNLSGKWYYLAKAEDVGNSTFEGYVVGQMATGYKEIDGDGFYLNNSGVMETSTWKDIDKESYYFGSNGAMVRSKSLDDIEVIKRSGRNYPVDIDGSPLEEDMTVYYYASRYTTTEPSSTQKGVKTYTVHSKGYLVESK